MKVTSNTYFTKGPINSFFNFMGKSGIEPNSSVHETNMLTDALFPLNF